MIIDGVEVIVNGEMMTMDEIRAYVQRGKAAYENLDRMVLHVPYDKRDEVEITYHIRNRGFERIRRITGYLVGGMDRWNDAKRAEERDRVAHWHCVTPVRADGSRGGASHD